MNVELMSKNYTVRRLERNDVEILYELMQKKSSINTIRCLSQERGFLKIRLGVDKGNPQSFAFWTKNGFSVVSEDEYIIMEMGL